jgi:hypothetical protein
MSYLNKNPRQRAVMLFPNPAAAKLCYTGEIENRRELEFAQQVQQGTFDSLSANTVLIGNNGRIRALPNGIAIEVLGIDGIWKTVIQNVQPAPT